MEIERAIDEPRLARQIGAAQLERDPVIREVLGDLAPGALQVRELTLGRGDRVVVTARDVGIAEVREHLRQPRLVVLARLMALLAGAGLPAGRDLAVVRAAEVGAVLRPPVVDRAAVEVEVGLDRLAHALADLVAQLLHPQVRALHLDERRLEAG